MTDFHINDPDLVVPRLDRFDLVVINSSGGKDSQAMTDYVVFTADSQGYPRDKLVMAHADLGRVEWPGTKELVQEHADHYGLRLVIEKRPQGDLLDHVEQRGMWPSSTARYCTSDHKRGQIQRAYTYLTREIRDANPGHPKPRIINCFGFRSEESPARAKRKPWSINKVATTKTTRDVFDWLPIHCWLEPAVWKRIKQAGTRHHWAYDRGMTRLSCRFCIFAPRSQLMVSACQPENKELFEEYVALEDKMGHTFRKKQSLREIKEAIEAGETPSEDDTQWNM